MDAKRQRGENNAANTQQQAQTNHVANAQQQAQANAQLRNPFVMQLFTQHVARRLNRRDLNSLRAVNRHTRDAIDAYPQTEVAATRIARVKRDQVTGFDQIGPYATEEIMSHLDNPDDIESLREASMTTQRFVEGDARARTMAALARASPDVVLEYAHNMVVGGRGNAAYDNMPDNEKRILDRYSTRAFIASGIGPREWRSLNEDMADYLLFAARNSIQEVLEDMNPDRVATGPASALASAMTNHDDENTAGLVAHMAFRLAKLHGPTPEVVFLHPNQTNGPPSPAATRLLAHMLATPDNHARHNRPTMISFAKYATERLIDIDDPVTYAHYQGTLQSAVSRYDDLIRRMRQSAPGGPFDNMRARLVYSDYGTTLLLDDNGYSHRIFSIAPW